MAKLEEIDPLAFRLMELEEDRQKKKIILVPSESVCAPPIREALCSNFTNIYAEGYPSTRMSSCSEEELQDFRYQDPFFRRYYDRRYYKGCDLANYVESLAKRRCAELFAGNGIAPDDISVNVQPLSGAVANSAIYTAFLKPGDALLSPALDCGGHLSHGSPSNRSGMLFDVVNYRIDRRGKLEYSQIEELALKHKPRMIISGFSAYPYEVDWKRLREICDEVGCYLMADVAHQAGLIAAGLFPSPIGYADAIMFTTHKTMLGPRGAVILTTDLEKGRRIDRAVFPGEQGGPHINSILAKAVCFKLAKTEEFRTTQKKIVENCRELATELRRDGVELAYGGTSTHMLLVDLAATFGDLTGEIASRILDLCGIVVNKNSLPGDKNPVHPTGIRLGTVWATQIGMSRREMDELASLIVDVLQNIEPFFYTGSSHPIGRGKIAMEVMERTKVMVGRLLGEKNGLLEARNGYLMHSHYGLEESVHERALFDMGDMCLLRIGGERSFSFLQDVVSVDLSPLKDGDMARSLMLKDGKVLDDLLILKLSSDDWALTVHPDRAKEVKSWLQGLSDGYILFDKDLLKKVDGPVTIEPFDRVMISLYGEMEKTSKAKDHRLNGWHHFYVDEERAGSLWEELIEGGARPAGLKARERLMGREEGDAKTVYERSPSLFSPSKVYFIGRDSIPIEKRERSIFKPPTPKGEKSSPLYDEHVSLNANMCTFAGWRMPLSYGLPSDEHLAVRTKSGLFDLSHMGIIQLEGEHVDTFLDIATTNHILPMEVGRARYTYILSPQGEVIDDVIIYRLADRYMMVCNAINEERVKAWLRAINSKRVKIDDDGSREVSSPVTIRDLKAEKEGEKRKTNLALQGPKSKEALSRIGIDVRLKRNQLMRMELNGFETIISRTGYTGERFGYEIYTHPKNARIVWGELLEEHELVKPCGLAARDSTRIEAGFPLYGREIEGELKITPTEAGYGHFIKSHKVFFVGREEYLKKRPRGKVVKFKIPKKGARVIRFGEPVVISGKERGRVTSSSLVGGKQMGMAFVSGEIGEGSKIGILTHGKVEEAIVIPRFLLQV
jgi:glycine hydroxymethyltransferase